MTLLDLIDKNLIKVPLLGTNKLEVIDELIAVYQKATTVSSELIETIRKAVVDRELQGSTAMDNSIAMPHAKVSGLDKAAVVIGVSRIGVDFGGEEKSKIFFLVLTPIDNPSEHIQLLASIAKLCSSPVFSRLLQGVHSRDDLYQLLVD